MSTRPKLKGAPQPKLLVLFDVWGKPGENIQFSDRRGRVITVGRLQEARDFARDNGYTGIRVKTAETKEMK